MCQIRFPLIVERSLFFLLSFSLVLLLPSCKNYDENSTGTDVSGSSIEDGKALAKTYCQSCHMLPDPSLVNKKSWAKGVLPEMGPRLGIFSFGYILYPRVTDGSIGDDFYPRRSLLTSREWQSIIDYFKSWLPLVNRQYEELVRTEKLKAEEAARSLLRLQREQEEKRLATLRSLKF